MIFETQRLPFVPAKSALETFIDRGHLQRLAKPTITATGKRIPGLKLDNPRQLALSRRSRSQRGKIA
jgi:hypothetical protein